MFAGQEKEGRYVDPQIVYIGSNSYWEDLEVVLPKLPASMYWERVVDTWKAEQELFGSSQTSSVIKARSVKVFMARQFS